MAKSWAVILFIALAAARSALAVDSPPTNTDFKCGKTFVTIRSDNRSLHTLRKADIKKLFLPRPKPEWKTAMIVVSIKHP